MRSFDVDAQRGESGSAFVAQDTEHVDVEQPELAVAAWVALNRFIGSGESAARVQSLLMSRAELTAGLGLILASDGDATHGLNLEQPCAECPEFRQCRVGQGSNVGGVDLSLAGEATEARVGL